MTDRGRNETDVVGSSLEDPLAEATRILESACERGIPIRATGGVAVALLCQSARQPPLRRTHQDIDFAIPVEHRRSIERLFLDLGYAPEEEFNLLHGHRRLFFTDRNLDRQADVFINRIEMCHSLDLRDRLERVDNTLAPADLLLSKLQVVETNNKDYLDMVALLIDLPLTERDDRGIDLVRIREICGSDWGWWKTATLVGGRVRQFAEELCARHPEIDAGVVGHVDTLLEDLERAPKSRKWKLRARIGERVRWHELPDDIDHDPDHL